ncbi:MAG: hypothetical protein EZS28_009708 [Streblomastix strix]|uniref:Uncharacterized protein n=1 Tax=Streblomastix strix TaxID=222440 RepID=A0A5J4WIN8_9EUKA|nr:MAG: hypothetical protein EZS28_009708 [Streblomastix strix]
MISIQQLEQVFNAKRRAIDNVLQSQQTHFLYNFKLWQGALIKNGKDTNFFKQAMNTIYVQLNRAAAQHLLGEQMIVKSDITCKNTIGINNYFVWNHAAGPAKSQDQKILLAGTIGNKETNNNGDVKLERKPSTQTKKTQITITKNQYVNSKLKTTIHLPSRQRSTGPYTPRNAVIPQTTIFHPTLNTEQEIAKIPKIRTKETINDQMNRQMLKGFDLIPVGKIDQGQNWLGFGPRIRNIVDRRKSKQQGLPTSMEELKAF